MTKLNNDTFHIFIDESGSINDKKRGIFEIAFLIIPTPKVKKTTNYYSKRIRQFKADNEIPIEKELKGHFLKKHGFTNFIDTIFDKFLDSGNKIVSGYLIIERYQKNPIPMKPFFIC